MITLDQVTQALFAENRATSIHSDGAMLIVSRGAKETRINNWQAMTVDQIRNAVNGSSINENINGNKILING